MLSQSLQENTNHLIRFTFEEALPLIEEAYAQKTKEDNVKKLTVHENGTTRKTVVKDLYAKLTTRNTSKKCDPNRSNNTENTSHEDLSDNGLQKQAQKINTILYCGRCLSKKKVTIQNACYLYKFLNITLAQSSSGKPLLLYVELFLCVYQ